MEFAPYSYPYFYAMTHNLLFNNIGTEPTYFTPWVDKVRFGTLFPDCFLTSSSINRYIPIYMGNVAHHPLAASCKLDL